MYPIPIYKRKKDILSFILLFLFAYSFGKGLIEVSDGASLGGIMRIFLPSAFYFGLFVFFSLINLEEIKGLISLPDIKFKEFFFAAGIALLLIFPGVILGSNYGLTDFIIGLFIVIGFFTSIYFTIIGNGSYGVAIFLLTFPFISFFEYYYRHTFFGGIEWGPIILTPTIIFLFVLFFVSLLVKSGEETSFDFKSPIVKAIVVFVFILFISSLCSKNPISSIRYLILEWVYPLMFFIIILRAIRTEDNLKLLSHSTVACACLISFICFYFFLRGPAEVTMIREMYGQILSSNLSSGLWGRITAMVLPLSIVLFLLSKGKGKIAYILTIGFLFLSIVLSYARVALIAVLVALPILLREKGTRRLVYATAAILILVFALHKTLMSEYVFYRFQHIRTFTDLLYDSSVQTRLEGAKAALRMIKDYPIFGIGCGMWEDYVPQYAKMQLVVKGIEWGRIKHGLGYIMDAHNLHFQIAATSGIPGFVAWIFLLIVIFREAFYVLYKSHDKFCSYLMLGAMSSLLCFFVLSFAGGAGGFSRTFSQGGGFLGYRFLFWIVVAIIVKLKNLEKSTQGSEPD